MPAPPILTIDPADDQFDAAMIRRNDAPLLITGLNSDHPAPHNRLAEALVRILSRPENEALIAEALGEGEGAAP